MRFVFWGLVFLGALLVGDFAASNTQFVWIALWPFLPPQEVGLRLYLLVIALLLVGFFAGRLAAWLGARRWRREWRQRGQRIEALERELAALGSRRPAGDAGSPIEGRR
jgi:membrane protein implicated in regulation of membrane protease activity